MWKYRSLQRPMMMLFLLCLLPRGAMAQSEISGTANDGAGEADVGASVIIVGPSTVRVADFSDPKR
jgi:hypothetical protein